LSTKQFTVNIISDSFVEAANSTSVESPVSMDEWVIGGLTPEPSVCRSLFRLREL
jgi:flavin reductase (DIM6/NTAB) family NADH-FMN oxidoreductase RutF